MGFLMIPGIFFLIMVVVLICIATRGVPVGMIIIFGLLYFQAIVVNLVIKGNFSLEGIFGMEDIFGGIFINPLTAFDSALVEHTGVAVLELSIFAIVLIFISYKTIYNNLKNTVKKKHAFLYAMIIFGVLFIGVFGGGMPMLWTMIYFSLLENLIFIIIIIIIIAIFLFIIYGTNWLKQPLRPSPIQPETIDELSRKVNKELELLNQLTLTQTKPKKVEYYE